MAKLEYIDKVLKDFKKVHGNKYNYSKVNYSSSIKKIEIICSEHGSFFQQPFIHKRGHGCPKCSKKNRLSKKIVIDRFNKIHNSKYKYIFKNYINTQQKIEIICPEHGSFFQSIDTHFKHNCPKCSSKKLTNAEFIKRSKKNHSIVYDYSRIKYINRDSKVEIICPEHGSFFQRAGDHLNGSNCPNCNIKSTGELRIKDFLDKKNIKYNREYIFKNCKNIKPLPFDFYLPEKNILIEYDGEQHFKAIEYFGGEEALEKTQRNDNIKTTFAENNGIKLIRIPYKDFMKINKTLESIL